METALAGSKAPGLPRGDHPAGLESRGDPGGVPLVSLTTHARGDRVTIVVADDRCHLRLRALANSNNVTTV